MNRSRVQNRGLVAATAVGRCWGCGNRSTPGKVIHHDYFDQHSIRPRPQARHRALWASVTYRRSPMSLAPGRRLVGRWPSHRRDRRRGRRGGQCRNPGCAHRGRRDRHRPDPELLDTGRHLAAREQLDITLADRRRWRSPYPMRPSTWSPPVGVMFAPSTSGVPTDHPGLPFSGGRIV